MRATGTRAGNYAIVGPSWKGELPAGVTQLTPSRTPSAFILGRTLLSGPDDLPAIRALMAQYKLTPLSLWGKPGAKVPETFDVFKPIRQEDRLAGRLEDDEQSNGREPAAVPPRKSAHAIRANRHRSGARCRQARRGDQARSGARCRRW